MQAIQKVRHRQVDVDGLEAFFREAGRPGQYHHTFENLSPPTER